jgi:hypothetical protein
LELEQIAAIDRQRPGVEGAQAGSRFDVPGRIDTPPSVPHDAGTVAAAPSRRIDPDPENVVSNHLASRRRPAVEQLETRDAPVAFEPSALEQLFLERLNDARANPAAYGASIGLDLGGAGRAQPLAFNAILVAAARLHSQDMAGRGFFAHNTPEGVTPFNRVTAAGLRRFKGPAESISFGTGLSTFSFDPATFGFRVTTTPYSPSDSLRALVIDEGVPNLGHRRHLLSLDPSGRSEKLIGIGEAVNPSGASYYTLDSVGLDTRRGQKESSFITGCVFRDANSNGLYDVGEGLGGVRLKFTRAGQAAGSEVSWSAGGYTHAVSEPGAYKVTATGAGLPGTLTRMVRVRKENVRVNFVVK